MRHHNPRHLETPFGRDTFGVLAERFARFFGTPKFIIAQTLIVTVWIAGNAILLFHFDPMPFILLNLGFSTQAAYAAPLILLAQTRQADRDKTNTDRAEAHREQIAEQHKELLVQNTELTRQIRDLTDAIHERVR